MEPTGSNPAVTVGILYCGDMGSAFGKVLRKGGLRVVTTCEGRSRATHEEALKSGIEVFPTLDDVVGQSHIVFSLVLPAAALEMARQYANRHQLRPQNSVFVEANSIGVETFEQIERLMAERNVPLVDATFNGSAHRLEDLGVLHISGPRAKDIEMICQGLMRVNYLGPKPGSATLVKLLMSVVAKGMAGLFLEVGALAERAGVLDSFLHSCHLFYPSILTAIERMLPTYPRHAVRRAGEMGDIEQLGRVFQLSLSMTHGAGEWIKVIAGIPWDQMELETSADMRTVIRSVAKACPLENPSNSPLEV